MNKQAQGKGGPTVAGHGAQAGGKGSKAGQKGKNGKGFAGVCYRCGKTGHRASGCHVKVGSLEEDDGEAEDECVVVL